MVFSSACVLEFETLRELLNAYASSELGRARIAELQPSCDHCWITGQQQLVAEVLQFLRGGGHFDFSGLLGPTALLEKAHIAGAALETLEIRDLIVLIDRAAQWREIVLRPPSTMKVEWKAIAVLSSGIADFTALLRFFQVNYRPSIRVPRMHVDTNTRTASQLALLASNELVGWWAQCCILTTRLIISPTNRLTMIR